MTSPGFLRIRSASSATVIDSGSRSVSRGPASAAGAATAAGFSAGGSAGTGIFSTAAAGADDALGLRSPARGRPAPAPRAGAGAARPCRRPAAWARLHDLRLGRFVRHGPGGLRWSGLACGRSDRLLRASGRGGRGRRGSRPLVNHGRLRGRGLLGGRRPHGRRRRRRRDRGRGGRHGGRGGGDRRGGLGRRHDLLDLRRGRRLGLRDRRGRDATFAPGFALTGALVFASRRLGRLGGLLRPGPAPPWRRRPWPPRSWPAAPRRARPRAARPPCGSTRRPGRRAPPGASRAELSSIALAELCSL